MVVVVDYGMGNIRSVSKAFEACGAEVKVSSDPKDLEAAERIVLPGVGAFGDCMDNLQNVRLLEVLREEVVTKKKPYFGICLGMQILAKTGEEKGHHHGLGWLPGRTIGFSFNGSAPLKVPHIGWNNIEIVRDSPLWKGLGSKLDFYFVHSFHLVTEEASAVAATCEYGICFNAAVQKDNIFATQFHPEKSQECGLKIIRNFMVWKP
ncbi:MAG: imidazole glycerol phosphate synthase subunit HisH [Verrucomicrobiae bacterium]|nr:imidazole glycerol phosphate synthase subunit HisH [Verrucomicrobiae bacterium]